MVEHLAVDQGVDGSSPSSQIMSCEECEKAQDAFGVYGGYYYRWKTANIAIIGCKKHVKELMEALNVIQSKKEKEKIHMEVEYKGKKYQVKYKHIRLAEEDGTEHGKILPNGGQTIAYIELEDGKTIEAQADCSIKDTYCKKLGRIISSGRLEKLLREG